MSYPEFYIDILEAITRDDSEYRNMHVYRCEMNSTMKSYAADIIQRGFELYKSTSDTVEYIQKQFNSKYCGSDWNCIICKTYLLSGMSFYLKYTQDRFIFLRFHEYEIVLWGIPN